MLKRSLVLVGAVALLAAACGGDEAEPRSLQAGVSDCKDVPVTTPGLTIAGQRVDSIHDLRVCVNAQVSAGSTVSITPQENCGSPCFSVVANGVTAGTEAAVTVTFLRGSQTEPTKISVPVPPTRVDRPLDMCVIGIGEPDPCTQYVGSPGNVSATASGGGVVQLSWSESADLGGAPVAGYEVWRSTTGDSATFSFVSTTPSVSATDQGLTVDTKYFYFVLAFDGDGNRSDASIVVSATVQ